MGHTRDQRTPQLRCCAWHTSGIAIHTLRGFPRHDSGGGIVGWSLGLHLLRCLHLGGHHSLDGLALGGRLHTSHLSGAALDERTLVLSLLLEMVDGVTHQVVELAAQVVQHSLLLRRAERHTGTSFVEHR